MSELRELKDRIELFIKVNSNSLEIGELTEKERETLHTQNATFSAVLVLIRQLLKKGTIWKGGYKDNIGVIYADQVQEILDEQEAVKSNQKLDDEFISAVAD